MRIVVNGNSDCAPPVHLYCARLQFISVRESLWDIGCWINYDAANAIVKMIPSFSPFKRKIYWVIIKSTNSVRGRPGPIKRGLHSFQGFCHNALDLNILAQFTLCFLGIIFSATRIQIKWKKESEHALTSGITKRGLLAKLFSDFCR